SWSRMSEGHIAVRGNDQFKKGSEHQRTPDGVVLHLRTKILKSRVIAAVINGRFHVVGIGDRSRRQSEFGGIIRDLRADGEPIVNPIQQAGGNDALPHWPAILRFSRAE